MSNSFLGKGGRDVGECTLFLGSLNHCINGKILAAIPRMNDTPRYIIAVFGRQLNP